MNTKIIENSDGSYLTVTQLKFFLNRDNGPEDFKNKGEDFLSYFEVCRAYNLISDILEKTPDAGYLYWDDKKDCVSFAFPALGIVDDLLNKMESLKGYLDG